MQHVHSDDRPATEATVAQALYPAGSATLDVNHCTATSAEGGRVRWKRATGQAFFDGASRPLRLVGTVADVTAAKETALRFQLLADNPPC